VPQTSKILSWPSPKHGRPGITQATFTFDSTTTSAATPYTVLTISGRVFLKSIFGFVTTTLVSAGGGSVALGTTAVTNAFIGATTATNLTTGLWWDTAAGSATGSTVAYNATGGNTAAVMNKLLAVNVIINIATADVTGGVLEIYAIYLPLTDGAKLI